MAADQGLGRSRSGFTGKIVWTAADATTAMAVDVIPGQTHEASHLGPMLEATAACVPDIEEAVTAEGFNGEPQRQVCRDRDIEPVIPYKANCTNPGWLNPRAYRARNWIERLSGKLKEFCRVATRYEELKQTFWGTIHLALSFIRLRFA